MLNSKLIIVVALFMASVGRLQAEALKPGSYVLDHEERRIGLVKAYDARTQMAQVEFLGKTNLPGGRLKSAVSSGKAFTILEEWSKGDLIQLKSLPKAYAGKLALDVNDGDVIAPLFRTPDGKVLYSDESSLTKDPRAVGFKAVFNDDLKKLLPETPSKTLPTGQLALIRALSKFSTEYDVGLVDAVFGKEFVNFYKPVSDEAAMTILRNPRRATPEMFDLNEPVAGRLDSSQPITPLDKINMDKRYTIMPSGTRMGPIFSGHAIAKAGFAHIVSVDKYVTKKGRIATPVNMVAIASPGHGSGCLRLLKQFSAHWRLY